MKAPVEKKKTTETAEVVLATTNLETYTRSSDGATMVEIASHVYVSAANLGLASGRGRMT